MANTYDVTATIQAPDNPPTPMNWGRNMTALDAVGSVLSNLRDEEGRDHTHFHLVSITVTVNQEES